MMGQEVPRARLWRRAIVYRVSTESAQGLVRPAARSEGRSTCTDLPAEPGYSRGTPGVIDGACGAWHGRTVGRIPAGEPDGDLRHLLLFGYPGVDLPACLAALVVHDLRHQRGKR